jgi:hypothetical protein
VDQARGLLGLAQSNGLNFAVYDLSADCEHPKLASSSRCPIARATWVAGRRTARRTTSARAFEA